jgi:hypothetical protein
VLQCPKTPLPYVESMLGLEPSADSGEGAGAAFAGPPAARVAKAVVTRHVALRRAGRMAAR